MEINPILLAAAFGGHIVLGALAVAAAAIAAGILEHERRAAFALRTELERRATSDNMTGVSNRAHILQLAQNEFARAR